jgi:hypothetical protein
VSEASIMARPMNTVLSAWIPVIVFTFRWGGCFLLLGISLHASSGLCNS